MPQPLKATRTFVKHEMDYLAVIHVLGSGSLTIPDSNNTIAPIWTINGGQDCVIPWDFPTQLSAKSINLTNLRNAIGDNCRWCCPGQDKAISADHAIEIIAQQLQRFHSYTQRVKCPVPVDLGPKRRQE
jgi:hypothetical protein